MRGDLWAVTRNDIKEHDNKEMSHLTALAGFESVPRSFCDSAASHGDSGAAAEQ